jgi:hypothetical protein
MWRFELYFLNDSVRSGLSLVRGRRACSQYLPQEVGPFVGPCKQIDRKLSIVTGDLCGVFQQGDSSYQASWLFRI